MMVSETVANGFPASRRFLKILRPDNDTVYILGDLIYRSSISGKAYLKQMKGKKYLITGNHDHRWIKNVCLDEYFESVNYYLEIKDEDNRIALCHYPMLRGEAPAEGATLFMGTFTITKMDSLLKR